MTSSSMLRRKTRYHVDATEFVFDALRHTQERLGRAVESKAESRLQDLDDEQFHITGQELLHGIREFALQRFGLMARLVFASWNVTCTEDFGRIVFELVEQGRMRKTERDQLDDFAGVYEFEQALDRDYRCSTQLPETR
jgi:uncharacterized repeat protein (TIGR04138 family)